MRKPSPVATFTSTPEIPAPQFQCPTCERPLVYRQTVYNGIHPRERWDYLECRWCGMFEYRERTRKLRHSVEIGFKAASRPAPVNDETDLF